MGSEFAELGLLRSHQVGTNPQKTWVNYGLTES